MIKKGDLELKNVKAGTKWGKKDCLIILSDSLLAHFPGEKN